MIRVHTIGQSVIETPRGPLMPDASINFSLALYLAFERGRRVDRGELETLLWPGMPASNARHCLRQAIYKLRQSGVEIETGNGFVRLPPDAVRVDVDQTANDDPASTVAEGDFLPGFTPATAAYAEWLDGKRDLATSRQRQSAHASMTAARARGRWADVERFARRALELDPLNEEATLALAEATALTGAKARAVEILDRYIADLGGHAEEIRLPAALLRRRIAERLPVPRYAASSELVFVGRESDMEVLLGQLANARAGAGGGALLWGEPGIGKSRLAAELNKVATLQGANVQRMVCQASDPTRPFSLYADIAPLLLEMPGALGISPESLAALKRLTEPSGSTSARTESYDAEYLFATVRRALFDLVDAVSAEKALVILIEDAHWLDPTSWSILAPMIEWSSTRKLLFVMTSRSAHPETAPATMPAALWAHHVRPLEAEAGVRLVDAFSRLRQRPADASFRDWCVQVADGNPLFLAELTARWVETGQREGLPPSLAELIRQRIERVSPITLRAFQACVLLGKSCTLPRLESVLEYRQHELIDAMAEMEEHDLVLSHGPVVTSRHELLSSAALSRLPKLGRQALQRRIGTVLEPELLATKSASLLWDCVRNWDEAGETGKAYALALQCAEALLALGVPRDAIVAAELAERFAREPGEGAEARRVLAAGLYYDGQWTRLRTLLDQRKASAEYVGHCDEELWHYQSLETLGGQHGSDRMLERLITCAESSSSPEAHRFRAAILCLLHADNSADTAMALRAYKSVQELTAISEEAKLDALTIEMAFHTTFGSVDRAGHLAHELVEKSKECLSITSRIRALSRASKALRFAARADEAKQLTHTLSELAEQRSGFDRAMSLQSVAFTDALTGDLSRAEAIFAGSLAEDLVPDKRTSNYFTRLVAYASVLLKQGVTDHRALDEMVQLSDQAITTRRTRAERLACLQVLASLKRESLDPALAGRLLSEFEHHKALGGADWLAYSVARLRLEQGQHEGALEHLRIYISQYRRELGEVPQYLTDFMQVLELRVGR